MLLHIVLLHQTSALLWLAHYDPPTGCHSSGLHCEGEETNQQPKEAGGHTASTQRLSPTIWHAKGGGKRAAKGNQGGGKGLVAPPPSMVQGQWKQRYLVE